MFFFYLGVVASAARAGDELSFAAPFDAVAATGDRQVSPAWRAHGSAAVHRNFARLTPDRQSKAGALWSAESVGADQATLELTFRISGQGQHFFGDGLALWLSADRAFRAGAFHGADPRFAGVAVVADTFRNDEAAAAHRDLALVASGGAPRTRRHCSRAPRAARRACATTRTAATPSTGARACSSPSPPAPRRSRWTRPTTGPGSSARRSRSAGSAARGCGARTSA